MKILHFADQHIRDKSIGEAARSLAFIVETAKQERPNLIVSCGDLFDSNEVKTDSQSARLAIKTISQLADIAPMAIITGTYRHEGNAPEILAYARGKHDIKVASYPCQVFLYQGTFYNNMIGCAQPDAILTMIPAITKQYFKTSSGIADADQEIAQQMTGLFLGFGAACAEYKAPHVLMWHGGISGAKIPSGHVLTGMDVEISTDQIRLAGNGHDFLGCFYPGPVYLVKVDEQECGFWVHELDERDFIACLGHIHMPQYLGGDRPPGSEYSRYFPTPITKTVRFEWDLTDDFNGYDIMDYIMGEDPSKINGKTVRVDLRVWQVNAGEIDRDMITKALLSAGAIEVIIPPFAKLPRAQTRSESVLSAETLADKLVASAALRGETVASEVLELAGLLEHTAAEQLLEMVMGGAI